MTAIFCDDVRLEQGNKFSYMGIYNGTLQVPAFPIVLPKLCIVMTLYCPGLAQPPTSVTFNLFKGDDLLHQIVGEMPDSYPFTQADGNIADGRVFAVSAVMQIYPLQLTEPCELRARAICDASELKGGTLLVEASSATQPVQLTI